jgi:integrase
MHAIEPPAGLPGAASSAAAAFDHYQTNILPLLKHSSQTAYRSILRHHLRRAFKGLQFAQIDTACVQERLVTAMRGANLKRETIRSAVVLLQRIVKLAGDRGLAVGRLELRKLHLPVADLKPERVYTPPEALGILAAETEPQQRAFFRVLFLSGMRSSEVLGLQWPDIDFDAQTIHVRRSAVSGKLGTLKTANTAAPRAMSDQLAEYLREWRRDSPATASGLLFRTSTDRPIWRSHVYRSWLKPLCKRLGIQCRGLHAARHTFGHAAAKVGGASQVRDLLRHSSLRTTQRYVTTVDTDLRTINQAVTDQLLNADQSRNAHPQSCVQVADDKHGNASNSRISE